LSIHRSRRPAATAAQAFLTSGLQKLSWLSDPPLEQRLAEWAAHPANPAVAKYLAFVSQHPALFSRLVALGELGLDQGGEREEEIFSRQLELAAQLRRPAIVHTPDREKPARTRRMLALLKGSPLDPSRVLVDHVSPETFALARGMGCWCGLTLQPGLFEAEAAAGLISRHGAERIVLTSDIGEGATDLLALPKADEALKAAGLTAGLRRRVLWEGPLGFLKS